MAKAAHGCAGADRVQRGRRVAGALAALILLAAPAAAQEVPAEPAPSAAAGTAAPDPAAEGSAPGASPPPDAPLILAPDEAGRIEPWASTLAESGGVNGFAMEAAPEIGTSLPSASLPVVVELFTSQGCSSCPPADAMLTMLADAQDVLPLSYHVDYWDYLGWADSFAKPEFTERQHAYASAAGERSLYTPQIIVDGQDTSLAPGPAQLMGLIDGHRYAPALVNVRRETTPEGETIELMPLSDLGGSVRITMVRYAPERQVEVGAGENDGRVVTYTNVVLSLEDLSQWDGRAALRLTVRPEYVGDARYPPDTRHALLVQQTQGKKRLPGQILAAILLD